MTEAAELKMCSYVCGLNRHFKEYCIENVMVMEHFEKTLIQKKV